MNSFKTLLCLAFEWWLWTNHCGQETVRPESMGKALVVFTQNHYQSQSHVGSLVVMVQAPRLALPSQFVWLPPPRPWLWDLPVLLMAKRFCLPGHSVYLLYEPVRHAYEPVPAPRLELPSQFVWLPAPRLALQALDVELFARRLYIPLQIVKKLSRPDSHTSYAAYNEHALWCDFIDNVVRLIIFFLLLVVLYLLKVLVGLCDRVKQHLFQ